MSITKRCINCTIANLQSKMKYRNTIQSTIWKGRNNAATILDMPKRYAGGGLPVIQYELEFEMFPISAVAIVLILPASVDLCLFERSPSWLSSTKRTRKECSNKSCTKIVSTPTVMRVCQRDIWVKARRPSSLRERTAIWVKDSEVIACTNGPRSSHKIQTHGRTVASLPSVSMYLVHIISLRRGGASKDSRKKPVYTKRANENRDTLIISFPRSVANGLYSP